MGVAVASGQKVRLSVKKNVSAKPILFYRVVIPYYRLASASSEEAERANRAPSTPLPAVAEGTNISHAVLRLCRRKTFKTSKYGYCCRSAMCSMRPSTLITHKQSQHNRLTSAMKPI